MKQSTYCLISPIDEYDQIYPLLYSIEEMLRNHNIPHSLPKLNWHITHVTPFLATAFEMEWLALGLEIGKVLSPPEHNKRLIKGIDFQYYENEEEDALVLRLETNEAFRSAISRARAVVQKITEMRYTPESFQANFHVTIAQGKGLRKSIEQHAILHGFLMGTILRKLESPITTLLQYPSIFLKENGYWVPVVS